MSYIGTVSENGVVTLPPEAKMHPGDKVRVELLTSKPADAGEPVGRKLLAVSGMIKDWPSDFAANHDHYLHGAPKRAGSLVPPSRTLFSFSLC